ncbi:fg-gap repeat protein [Seminavis robusta]|uniref:Fg-gap repeat protein n=1 Tax=Seminavis robusta TaxID=568900 RepID=A0A9N8HRS9_9STRA|nr:fg-gap repeat protein [Seminavis robusta]|eukprot:Sro1307_g261330.1 fg-gap repeat protein (537) ;mRNA; f:10599-12311
MDSHNDNDNETSTNRMSKCVKVGSGLFLLVVVSAILAVGSFPPGASIISPSSLSLSNANSQPHDQEKEQKERELYMNCATDNDCPTLYCPTLPCTAFYCAPDKICMVTTATMAPSGLSGSLTSITPGPTPNTPVPPPTTTPPMVTPAPMTPSPITPAPMTPSPITPVPVTPAPMTPSPVTPAPMTPSPVTPAPVTPAPETIQYTFAGNDRCSSAVGPLPWTAEGLGPNRIELLHGSNVGATFDATQAAPTCNSISHTSPGAWYTVIGTGDRMTASTCHSGTNYDTAISILQAGDGGGRNRQRGLRRKLKNDDKNNDKNNQGNAQDNNNQGTSNNNNNAGGCNGLTCVAANDDASGFCQLGGVYSTVRWDSVRGRTYYILVHGFNNRVGNFDLNVINARPNNERCDSATTLPIGGPNVIGTTYQANLPWGDNQATNCGGKFGLIGDTSSVWYHVTSPVTQTLEASTCHPLTDFDTKLHIFENSCQNSGGCLGGNDNYNSPQRCSLHQWTAEAGKSYYILIHAMLTDNGLFELSLRSV